MRPNFTRRGLLQAAGVTALGGWISSPGRARSEETKGTVHTLRVGEAEVVVVSDGIMSLPQSFVLPDAEQSSVDELFAPNAPSFAMAVNVTLIRLGGRVVLIDCGGGSDFMPGMGRFPDYLALSGISADEITDVILTHAHPDHFWGIIDPFEDNTRFPNARHFLMAAELDFWRQSDIETRVPTELVGVSVGTQRRLGLVTDRLSICSPDKEIIPGLHAIDTAGHTPGHLSLQLVSGGEQLFLSGDVFSHPVVSFAEPAWRWGSDMDWERAAKVRARMLDVLAHDRTAVLGYHLPWPGVGFVERAGGSYRFVV